MCLSWVTLILGTHHRQSRWHRASEVSVVRLDLAGAHLTAAARQAGTQHASTLAVGIYLCIRLLSGQRCTSSLESTRDAQPQFVLAILAAEPAARAVRKIKPGRFQRLLESPSAVK